MNNITSNNFKRYSYFPSSVPKTESKEAKKKRSSFYDDYLERSNQNKKETAFSINRPVLELPDLTPQKSQPNSQNPETTGSAIKKNIKSVLSQKYGELDTRHIFDDIDDKDIEDNIETAENTIKTSIDRGALSKNLLPKLPNLRDGLALSYAAANKGNNRAATRAREAAYTEQKSVESFDNLLLNESNNQPTIKPTKYSSFYDDYLKSKNSKDSKNLWNNISKAFDLPKANKNPRYVSADVLNMRSAPGTDSKVVDKLTDGTEVNYTGNKTKEIDGHLWAEVAYDGKTGWVAADYLKTAKPQESFSNDSVTASATPQKPAQSVSVDSSNTQNKIDINDHSALQSAFNSVRKPGAAEGDLGEPGDFDGVWGLQCVDLSNWFLTNYTTLGRVGGDGKDIVQNIANKHNLEVSTIPTAPAIYSVAGRSAGPGTSGRNDGGCGHTGVILSCKLTETGDYELTYFHSYNSLLKDGVTSQITKRTFTPEQLKNTTFFDLKKYMK